MEPRPLQPAATLLARTEVRLAGFGLCAVGAVYLGFWGVPVTAAELFIRHAGYPVMLFTFAWWTFSLWRLYRVRTGSFWHAWPRREMYGATALIALFTVIAVGQESFHSKILNDEFVLQSTAFNMHFFREVSMMVRGYDILGTFLSLDSYLDKRPYFYPFLISLAHDLTGYRTMNAHLVNTLLLPVSLGLGYHLGRILAGWRGGMLALGLLGSFPLLAQSATGTGMELANVTMLLTTIALAIAWLEKPDEARLSAFVLAAALLAQCRYESALYVLPAAATVLIGWWRGGKTTLSWPAVFVPLLFVPMALHNKVLSHSPVLWEMKENQTSRFGTEYLAANLRGVADHLFSLTGRQANSPLLSGLGAVAAIWLAAWLTWRLWRGPRTLAAPHVAWLCFGVVICANTALVQFYFWGSFADPMAARFSLPFCLLLVFVAVLFARWLDRRLPATPWLLGLIATAFLAFAIPRQARHLYSHLGIDEVEWERRFVASLPPGDRLIVSNKSTLPWLLQQTPSILLKRAPFVADRLKYQLGHPLFREVLVLQSLRPSSREGGYQLMPDEKLPPGFVLELMAERRFGTRIARISRLVAIKEGSGG